MNPNIQNRAYSLIVLKGIDEERRVIKGIATTPTPDLDGDVIEPLGISYNNPSPLLLHHDRERPVGTVNFQPPTPDGMEFEARLPRLKESGVVKSRVDEAWDSIVAGLIRGVSVGIRAMKDDVKQLKSGGLHFVKSQVYELSLVTFPANAEATIRSVKSIDKQYLAASGLHSPGDSGSLLVVHAVKAAPVMNTIPEQITNFENTRKVKAARLTDLMTKAAEAGVTLDASQSEEYDTLKGEVASVDLHLKRLRELEQIEVSGATPVVFKANEPAGAVEIRGGHPVITVKSNVEKGTAMTRFVIAKIMGKNSNADAIAYAESRKDWMEQTPEVLLALKAAVNPGTIAEPAWAAPLVVTRPMQNEWLELLRPLTLIDKLNGLRRVPFNISMPIQIGGGTYTWVGETAPKPVGNLQFTSATLGIAKAAGIIVISEELAKLGTPSAEGIIRNDMLKGMAQYLDTQFIDPTVAAVTNVSPASITNLAVSVGSAGTSAANFETDLKGMIGSLLNANQQISGGVVIIMSQTNALALSMARTSNGDRYFPDLSMTGGTILGIPVLVSQAAGATVAIVLPSEILFADDGGVNIDVSREATVEMSTTPTSPVSASTVMVSLWQQNLVGLRAERFINWKRARLASVRYTNQSYV